MAMRWVLFICFFMLSSCAIFQREPGRPPKIDGIPIPDNKRTLYIQNVRNNTYATGVHTRLTQILIEEFDRRGRFITTRDKLKATYRVYSDIIHYQQVGNMLDLADQQLSSELFMVCKLELVHADKGDKIPLERNEIPGRAYFSNQLGYRETEIEAQNRLLRVMAIRIAEETERAWYFSLSSKLE